ncbi:MAG: HepT-like ribonuclease domain-containing protein [Acidimicrobiales bacterium]
MPPPEDASRLAHLREAATKALRYSQGTSRKALEADEVLRLALTKLVEIVGEAAKQVSEPTRLAHPSVPWSAAARMSMKSTVRSKLFIRRPLAHGIAGVAGGIRGRLVEARALHPPPPDGPRMAHGWPTDGPRTATTS